jgi:hypothetical protein
LESLDIKNGWVFSVTKNRGRPPKDRVKTAAERKRDQRKREELRLLLLADCGVERYSAGTARDIKIKTFPPIRQPVAPYETEAEWKSRRSKHLLAGVGLKAFEEICGLDLVAIQRAFAKLEKPKSRKSFYDLHYVSLYREDFQNRQSAVYDSAADAYECEKLKNHEYWIDEEDILEARGTPVFEAAWRKPSRRAEPCEILWRGRYLELSDYYREKHWPAGPMCRRTARNTVRRPLGQSVEIVPMVPFSAARFGAMEDVPQYAINETIERASAGVGEWTLRVARGHVGTDYVAHTITVSTDESVHSGSAPSDWPISKNPRPLSNPRPYSKRETKPIDKATFFAKTKIKKMPKETLRHKNRRPLPRRVQAVEPDYVALWRQKDEARREAGMDRARRLSERIETVAVEMKLAA